jgi:hypothetical protein
MFSFLTYDISIDIDNILLLYHNDGLDKTYIDILFVYIISSFMLVQIINLFDIRTLLLFIIFVITIFLISLLFIKNYEYIQISYLLISGFNYIFIILSIINFMEIWNNNPYASSTLFIIALLSGNIILEYTNINLTNSIYIYIAIFVMLFFSKNTNQNINNIDSNFIFLIKSIEPELVISFTMSYVIANILYFYQTFVKVARLSVSNVDEVIYHAFQTIIIAIIPCVFLIKNRNKYFVNLFLMIIIAISFILMMFYGKILTYHNIIIAVIGISVCSLFISNITNLYQKFNIQDFKTSISLYFSMSSIGVYSGIISSDLKFEFLKKHNFTLSIFIVISILIIYYILYGKSYYIQNKI